MVDFDVLIAGGDILAAIVALISFSCSVLTILLIVDMCKWNGYMLLIFNLSSCQCLADISFFIFSYSLYSTAKNVRPIKVFLFTFGCVSVSMWTNVISYMLYNVVVYQKNVNILTHFNRFRAMVLFPGLTLGILMAAFCYNDFNQIEGAVVWLQFASIWFNLIVCGVVTYTLHGMDHEDIEYHPDINEPRETTYGKNNVNKPILELSRRIKYYPVVQVVCLLGLTWYFFGYDLHLFGPQHSATYQTIAWYAYCVLSPAAGIGYFIVFLIVQPFAYKRLRQRFRELMGLPVDRTMSAQSGIVGRLSSVSGRGSDSTESTAQTTSSSVNTFISSLTTSSVAVLNANANANTNADINRSSLYGRNYHAHALSDRDYAAMDDDMLIERIENAHRVRHSVSQPESSQNNPMADTNAL